MGGHEKIKRGKIYHEEGISFVFSSALFRSYGYRAAFPG